MPTLANAAPNRIDRPRHHISAQASTLGWALSLTIRPLATMAAYSPESMMNIRRIFRMTGAVLSHLPKNVSITPMLTPDVRGEWVCAPEAVKSKQVALYLHGGGYFFGAAWRSAWAASLSGVGSVVASNGADVTTESGGIIAALHFESGARVKKGDLLVSLSSATERADLQRLQAQADLANSEFARLERLYKLDAISKSELDRAQADLSAARAGADAQRAKLAQKQIRAPFSGQLGIRQVNVGQYLSAGTPIVSLQAINPVFVDFTLPEQDQARVQNGQTVTVVVDSQPGRTFSGVISAIEPLVDSKTRNFKVRARFDNADEALRPGLFARASIGLANTASVVTIPQTSVSYNPYGNSVYVIQSVKGKSADGKVR